MVNRHCYDHCPLWATPTIYVVNISCSLYCEVHTLNDYIAHTYRYLFISMMTSTTLHHMSLAQSKLKVTHSLRDGATFINHKCVSACFSIFVLPFTHVCVQIKTYTGIKFICFLNGRWYKHYKRNLTDLCYDTMILVSIIQHGVQSVKKCNKVGLMKCYYQDSPRKYQKHKDSSILLRTCDYKM